jgi:hypothetical protein
VRESAAKTWDRRRVLRQKMTDRSFGAVSSTPRARTKRPYGRARTASSGASNSETRWPRSRRIHANRSRTVTRVWKISNSASGTVALAPGDQGRVERPWP